MFLVTDGGSDPSLSSGVTLETSTLNPKPLDKNRESFVYDIFWGDMDFSQ